MFEGKEVKVLLAGAGAGKTTRLIHYIEQELEYLRPEEIAFVTFTRKGVKEGLTRVCNQFRYAASDFPYFRTIHSLAFSSLGIEGVRIFGKKEEAEFNRLYGFRLNRAYHDKVGRFVSANAHYTQDSSYLDFYDLERSGGVTSRMRAERNIDSGYYRSLVRAYEEYKADKCLVDFCDCLVRYVREGVSLPCKSVFVDECQDLSLLQWQVVEKAFVDADKVWCAGDDRQCLFRHQAANPETLIDLSLTYPVERLSHSYRVPLSVYRLANAITDFISVKSDNMLEPSKENGEGHIERLADLEQLSHYIEYDMADADHTVWYLLARNNAFLLRYADMLEARLIPYWTKEGFFMGGEVIRRINTYMKYSAEGESAKKTEFAEKYCIADFSAPFANSTMFDDDRKWVYQAYVDHYGITFLHDLCKRQAQIYVGTIHSVKGGEAENVAVLMDMSKRTRAHKFDELDDELRCLYVAATRTKNRLYFISSAKDDGFDSILDAIREEHGLSF